MLPSAVVGGRMKANVVREIAALRQNEFKKTLAMLRAQFNLSIMEAAVHNQRGVTLDVPLSYVGREPYDPLEMGKELVGQLREDGYTVSGTFLRFTVSWDRPLSNAGKTSPTPLIRVPKAR